MRSWWIDHGRNRVVGRRKRLPYIDAEWWGRRFRLPTLRQILDHHARVLHLFGFPLGLRQHQPRQGFRSAFIEHACEKRLRVSNKADLGPRQSELLPK